MRIHRFACAVLMVALIAGSSVPLIALAAFLTLIAALRLGRGRVRS